MHVSRTLYNFGFFGEVIKDMDSAVRRLQTELPETLKLDNYVSDFEKLQGRLYF